MLTSCHSTQRKIIAAINPGANDQVLDPSQLWLSNQYVLMDNLAIKLVHINAKNDYELNLAENISISANGKEVLITIKHAKFSDGSVISAEDVSKSLKRLILKGSAHVPLKEFIADSDKLKTLDSNISGIQIIDKKTIKLLLTKRVKELIYYLSLADCSILHQSLVAKDEIRQSDWKIVSGAYFLRNNTLTANKEFLLYSNDMPSEVQLLAPPQNSDIKELKNYDIGYSDFIDKNNPENSNLESPLKYATSVYQTLVYLVLNTNSSKFKNLEVRQKIAKSISSNLCKDLNPNFFLKASQFFLPDSFAFQKRFNPDQVLPEGFSTFEIPDFTILATQGTKKYTYEGLEKELSQNLRNKTTVSFTDEISRYKERKIHRDFDAYLVPTSMSYNVVTESLNLVYKSNIRFGNNPNGKIIKLLDEYQQSIGSSHEIIEQIVKEMTLESEIIPLFYVSSPKFYNSDKLDISEMNTAESLTFWKIRVK